MSAATVDVRAIVLESLEKVGRVIERENRITRMARLWVEAFEQAGDHVARLEVLTNLERNVIHETGEMRESCELALRAIQYRRGW